MSFHTSQTFTFGETPSATKWNYLWENDYALQDWSAFANDSFPIDLLDSDAVGAGYVKLAEVDWSSGATLDTGTIPAKRFLRIILQYLGNTADGVDLRFNNDSGNNYAQRRSINASSSTTDSTSQSSVEVAGNYKGSSQVVIDIANYATKEKVMFAAWTSGPGGGTVDSAAQVPNGAYYYGKWVNTSAQITRVQGISRTSTNWGTGGRMIVLGVD